MEFPQDVLQSMQLCEKGLRETVSAGMLVNYPELTATCLNSIVGRLQPSNRSAEEFLEWQSRILDLLNLACIEKTDIEASVELSSLILSESEGLELDSAEAALFHRVANLLSFKCFLFCSKAAAQAPFALTPRLERNGVFVICLMDEKVLELSRNLDASSRDTLDNWCRFLGDDQSRSEKAVRALYQWTITGLVSSVINIGKTITVMHEAEGEYVQAAELGSKLCEFMEEYNMFLESNETCFLYDPYFDELSRNANLWFRLGDNDRVAELGKKLRTMLKDLECYQLMIPISHGRKCKTSYCEPSKERKGKTSYCKPSNKIKQLVQQKISLEFLLTKPENKSYEEELRKVTQTINHHLALGTWDPSEEMHDPVPECFVSSKISRMTLEFEKFIRHEKYSEAAEAFARYFEEITVHPPVFSGENHPLRPCMYSGDLAEMSLFLDSLLWTEPMYREMRNNWSRDSSEFHPPSNSELLDSSLIDFESRGTSVKRYKSHESICLQQSLFLQISECVGDPLKTATVLSTYGTYLGDHSVHQRLAKESSKAEEAPHKRWIKKEIGLPFTTEEDVQKVHSCLNDPYSPGEHFRYDLPPLLKACRLLKCTYDIYSELLHNWTQGSANEAAWLKLLDSQKHTLETLTWYLNIIVSCLMDSKSDTGTFETKNGFEAQFNESAIKQLSQSLHVWAERGRARTLLDQLGPVSVGSISDTFKQQLIDFNKNNIESAIESIYTCFSACGGSAVFVEYLLDKADNVMAFVSDDCPRNHFFITPFFDNCITKRVEQLVDAFYEAVNPKEGKVEYNARLVAGYLEELYDMLIKPIWKSLILDSETTLVVVPDKKLNRVPFALLRDRERQKYLFELHPVSVAPSLRVLQHCESRLRYLNGRPMIPEKSILAVGDASYKRREDLLPGSATELTELAQRFPGLVYRLEKCDATTVNLLELLKECGKEEHVFGLLHLGIHCLWNPKFKSGALQFAEPAHDRDGCEPRSSSGKAKVRGDAVPEDLQTTHTPISVLVAQEAVASTSSNSEKLTGVFGEVGSIPTAAEGNFRSSSSNLKDILRSEDIIANGAPKWPTRLVVLSACNSSKGQVFSDGEVNLPRALMIAGVPATLVAQWKVVDKASPELMRVFYDSLQRGYNVAAALRFSMLHALRVHQADSASKIHEWGPFVVWGLPSVQLPKELLRKKPWDASLVKEARLQAEYCRKWLNVNGDKTGWEKLMNLRILKGSNFVVSAYEYGCTFDDYSAMYEAILAVLKFMEMGLVLETLSQYEPSMFPKLKVWSVLRDRLFYEITEQIFTLVPLDHLKKIEEQLEHCNDPWVLRQFRFLMRYTQAMYGSAEEALHYADDEVDGSRVCPGVYISVNGQELGIDTSFLKGLEGFYVKHSTLEFARQERAVVLRLTGRHKEALQELDELLARGDDHECLNQRSYLKHVMGDDDGALADARRAARRAALSETDRLEYNDSHVLTVKALPDWYRRRLSHVKGTCPDPKA